MPMGSPDAGSRARAGRQLLRARHPRVRRLASGLRSPRGAPPGRRRAHRREFIPAALLLAVFIATGATAIHLLPERPPVEPPYAPIIGIETHQRIVDVTVMIAQESEDTFRVHVDAMTPPGEGTDEDLPTYVLYLPRTNSEDYAVLDCRAPDCSQDDDIDFTTVSVTGQGDGATSAGDEDMVPIVSSAAFRVRADGGIGFDANGVSLRGRLPYIRVGSAMTETIPDPRVDVFYTPLDADGYVWDPSTHLTSSYGEGFFSYMSSEVGQEYVSAIDDLAADEDAASTFWAGLLAGVSGGAVIGALQEVMQTRRLQRLLGTGAASDVRRARRPPAPGGRRVQPAPPGG